MDQRRFRNGESSYFPATFSPENLNLNPYFYSPRRNSFPGTDLQSPFHSISDQNQTLESALSRLNLSSDFRRQTPPLNPVPVPVSINGLAAARQDLMDHYYSPGRNNVGLRGSLPNDGQNLGFGGAHQNLMVGQRASSNYGIGTVSPSPFRGWGVSGEHMCSNGSLCCNAVMNSGNHQGVYAADGYSFLQNKKSSSRRFNGQFPNSPRLYQNSPSIENLDGFSNGLELKNSNSPRSNSGYGEQRYDLGKEFESFSLPDLRGKIVFLAKDQNGSRILQEKLDKPDEGMIEMVVSDVLDYMADLMKNQFGSYFLQKLFGFCSEEQRTKIIIAVTKNSFQFVGICLNAHGARTMQKFLENLITPEQISLVISAICHGVVRLASDPNAQHVVRHCVISFSHEYSKHLLNEVAKNCFDIATDKSGCCVMQCCVENAQGETREYLINEIITNAMHLAEDPYGNYVVQHLLSQKIPGVTEQLLGHLRYRFTGMSTNKYASNVVEKFLTEAGEEHSTIIIMELINSPDAAGLLFDPFANYVIQRALSVSRGIAYQQLSNLILEHAPSMRNHAYGKKILSWFEKNKTHVHTCTSKRCQ